MQNNDKKVLLGISNLKQYFPLKKAFLKEQLFVRANDDISIDIYEGETLGLVGESGCGKSTLGRVLLQLYQQTDGRTMYSGKTRNDIAPKYVYSTLKKINKRLNAIKVAEEKRDVLVKEYENLKGDEKHEKHAKTSSAKKIADKQYLDLVSIIGGFIVEKDTTSYTPLFINEYKCARVLNKIRAQKQQLISSKNKYKSIERVKTEAGKSAKAATAKTDKYDAKIAKLIISEDKAELALKETIQSLNALRATKSMLEGFKENEALASESLDLAKLTYKEIRLLRSDLQLIFQDPYSSLNPRMTVGQIIGEGLLAHKIFADNDDAMQDYIMQIMEECGLAPYMIHRYPHQFSGGQRQRIGIARALALKPKFVVCDEAVSALDVSIQSQVINLLEDLKQKDNLTYLFISHDLSVVKYISDRIGVMYLGNIVELATAKDLFKAPMHPYTKALLEAIPTTDVETRGKIALLEGDIPSSVKPPKGCKFHTRCKYCTDICTKVVPDFEEVSEGHFVACHHKYDLKIV